MRHVTARLGTARFPSTSIRECSIDVRDDGVGMYPARGADVGLRSMHDRAAEVGGQCQVWSADGNGTEVTATLPLDLGAHR
jgi:signal transduction histidine kinase